MNAPTRDPHRTANRRRRETAAFVAFFAGALSFVGVLAGALGGGMLAAAPLEPGTPEPKVSAGELRLAAVFGDHMVLQRETKAPVFGVASPDAVVRARGSWMEREVVGRAGRDGAFRLDVPTGAAGGPHTLEVAVDGRRVVLEDVLLGDVWLASGQSNMEMPVANVRPGYGGVLDWESEVAAADHPNLRLFRVENELAAQPRREGTGAWSACTPESIREFSATAYFFGREVHRETGVPVGLVSSDWGGTVVEAWISPSRLATIPDFQDDLRFLSSDDGEEEVARRYRADLAAWWAGVDEREPPSRAAAPAADLDGWSTTSLPAAWAGGPLADHDGAAWFVKDVDVPAALAGVDLELRLGPIDDLDTTYWNGHVVGGVEEMGRWQEPRRYVVPGARVTAGRNRVAVRVVDTGGEGGLVRGEDGALTAVPIGRRGGDPLDLTGEWRWRVGADMRALTRMPGRRTLHKNVPTVLSNAMIEPLVPFALRGAIWYQGESNVGRDRQYRTLLQMLIEDWRDRFERDRLPFFYVQIAPYRYAGDRGAAAALRDSQRRTLAVPATGMAVTMDIGNPRDIHPKNKQEVGRRLALLALHDVYGRQELASRGPLYSGHRVDGDTVRVFFDHAEGLRAEGAPGPFVVAGADQVFHEATARVDGRDVVVRSDAVAAPVAVRFAFGPADEATLFNRAGLPASPFRTDDWPIGD